MKQKPWGKTGFPGFPSFLYVHAQLNQNQHRYQLFGICVFLRKLGRGYKNSKPEVIYSVVRNIDGIDSGKIRFQQNLKSKPMEQATVWNLLYCEVTTNICFGNKLFFHTHLFGLKFFET